MHDDWRANLVESTDEVRTIARAAKRIAVLGIKTEKQSGQPAFYVAAALQRAGVEVVPVPVYYPDVTEILGVPVVRRVVDVPGPIDIVDVFRRSEDVPGHLDDLLAATPKCVWLQSGIRNDQVAEALARAGIRVVQDRCLMVEHRIAVGGG
ncbi:CoA-binding protein [Sandaracinus amylolyticus]|uniref:CoA-binding protein n=1 Tax=Sandaracinus amylolyticus TaxID=927083 RepID=UPI001F1E66CD|nr:CoA-binding protein [Sandaracinus amylolyticus]